MEKKEKESGYLLYHKKPGFTSFGALNALKKALGTGKVGHTGTLDKFAEGLLIALTGKALKLAPLFTDCDKKYEGVIRFGEETDTLDPEGRVTARADPPSAQALEDALPLFQGDILQEPPVYSAIHINGVRASDIARSNDMAFEGKSEKMRKRPVSIYSLELVSYTPPFASIRVHCSKGTYIRSLARDIALAAGSRGHLISLIRTQIAGFYLKDAINEEDTLGGKIEVKKIDKSVFEKLKIPFLIVDGETADAMKYGKNLHFILKKWENDLRFQDGIVGIFTEKAGEKIFTALIEKIEKIEKDGGIWKYKYVYANN